MTAPFPVASDARRAAFIRGMRSVPGTVAIIATADRSERSGLAATSWTSLCADPPMILACVNQSASAHDLVRRTGKFSLNVVPASGSEIVAIFSAQRGLAGAARFAASDWSDGPMGQPLLNSAVLAIECAVETEHVHGTHSIFIGRVETIVQCPEADPLLYVQGGYAATATLGA